jgi:hypothetical protein
MTSIRLATFLGDQGIPIYEEEMREWQKGIASRVSSIPLPASTSSLSFAEAASKFQQAVNIDLSDTIRGKVV